MRSTLAHHPLDVVIANQSSFDLEIEELGSPMTSLDNCFSSASSASSAATSSGGSSSMSTGACIACAACWSDQP